MNEKRKTRLFLRRRSGQSVLIGSEPDQVKLTVEQDNAEIVLHFEAPRDVVIDRLEVAERKMQAAQ